MELCGNFLGNQRCSSAYNRRGIHGKCNEVNISYVKRFVRKLNNREMVPILSVIVGFEGTEIPKGIVLKYSILKVEVYIQLRDSVLNMVDLAI